MLTLNGEIPGILTGQKLHGSRPIISRVVWWAGQHKWYKCRFRHITVQLVVWKKQPFVNLEDLLFSCMSFLHLGLLKHIFCSSQKHLHAFTALQISFRNSSSVSGPKDCRQQYPQRNLWSYGCFCVLIPWYKRRGKLLGTNVCLRRLRA